VNHVKEPIYLDGNATTRVDSRVAAAIVDVWQRPGNASSRSNVSGRHAQAQLANAADLVAALCGGKADEMLWTSGATEANNIAIRGTGAACRAHVLSCQTEHASVLNSIAALPPRDCEEPLGTSLLTVGATGLLTPDQVIRSVTESVRIVSIMLVNNEIGVIQPIAEIAQALARHHPDVLFHCDASQAGSTLPINVHDLGVDLLSLSAHKMYGPQGIGALWVRNGVRVKATLFGGGQQGGRRPGTVPVALAVGFGEAARICSVEGANDALRIQALRDTLWRRLQSGAGPVHLNGDPSARVAGNLNVSFDGVFAEDLIEAVPELELSMGSACHGDRIEPSHVLLALGKDERLHSSIRIGLGRHTTSEEVQEAATLLCDAVAELRALTRACG
jgi:cysteine desulfurase